MPTTAGQPRVLTAMLPQLQPPSLPVSRSSPASHVILAGNQQGKQVDGAEIVMRAEPTAEAAVLSMKPG